MKDRAYPFALPLGTEISGYVVDRVIGAGGFGITYQATNPVTGVTVAIKEFFPQGLASRDGCTVILHSDVSSGSYEMALKKFEQEAAKLTGRYRHPNIVSGVNFLRLNNTAYFVMEYIEGISLDHWLLERVSPPSELELRALFERVFDAVDYIHSMNGMHRDLTPRNVMIRSDGEPILVDFGASGEGLDTERHDSQAFAQPNYAPPEQLTAEDARMQGRHTDIFSLGGMLYRALAGRPPIKPLTRSHAVALNGRPADPYVPAADAAREPLLYSTQFLAGVDMALRLDPRDRPATIEDLRMALGWLDDESRAVHDDYPAGDPSDEATRIYAPRAADHWTGDRTWEPETGLPQDAGYEHDLTAAPRPLGRRGESFEEGETRIAPPGLGDRMDLAPEPARRWNWLFVFGAVASVLLLVGLLFVGPEILSRMPKTTVDPGTPASGQSGGAGGPPRPGDQAAAGTDRPGTGSPYAPGPTITAVPQPKPRVPEEPAIAWSDFAGFALTGREAPARTVTGDGGEACRTLCRDDRTCQGYSLTGGNSCRLFSEASGLAPDTNSRSAVRPAGAAGLRAILEVESRRRTAFRTLDGVSLLSGGTPRTVANQGQCAFSCQADQSCRAWTYTPLANACRHFADIDPANAGPAVSFVTGIEDQDGQTSEAVRRSVTAKSRTAQAFVGAELAGRIVGRERSADGNACRAQCLANQACVAAVQAEGECTQYGQVDDIRRRADAEVLVDVRQTALVSRIDALVREKPPAPEANRGQTDYYAGFDVVGTTLSNDRTRGAGSPEECLAACSETGTCVGYSFAAADRRCTLLSQVIDVVPDSGRVSGIYRGAAPNVVELARKRLVQSEQARANYRDLPPNCAPDGLSAPVGLGREPTAEQCSFLCRSGVSCQGWLYSRTERTCQLFGSVAGAGPGQNVVAGVLDPNGRRAIDLARSCLGGPVPPGSIGGGVQPISAPPGAPPNPLPPANVASPGQATECDRAAGYLYDTDLPRGVQPRQFEYIEPAKAIPACLAVLSTAPQTARWRLALGRALERDGREVEARAAYREAAESGSGAAAFLYAIMLDKGQGGPEDDLEAERYYRLARSRGITPASTSLAQLYTYSDRASPTSDQDVVGLLLEAANRGHAPSMYRLGELYDRGRLNRRPMPQDPGQAYAWFSKAFSIFSRDADQRDPTALRFLSLHHDGGRGVPRNPELALKYLIQYLQAAYGPDNLVARRRGTIGDLGLEEWSVETRKGLQQFLIGAGGFADTVDGVIGGRTREAIERWLQIHG